ncbi:MAG: hypothetical protein K0Q79_2727 [Flavipsychrobacter sp.]|jgi:hypothetical protein|nr:hypothetical protein [Flavipsychrobacter sp.]
MKSIGGYFELESDGEGGHYHGTPYRMKNGRAALHYVLMHIKPTLVYVPYYTCDSLLEPFNVGNFQYRFYEINEQLEPKVLPELKTGEYFLCINYFGIKGDATAALSEKYKDKLIIDATQAFFMKGDGVSWLFNSCRKFFGVPDGGYLYAPQNVELATVTTKNEKYITTHLHKRLEGYAQEGYPFFQQNEELMDCEITGMSEFSERILSGIDYDAVKKRRLENFGYLHAQFGHMNLMSGTLREGDVPMCYPLLLDKAVDKSLLFSKNIFIPTLWKEVLEREPGYTTEKRITTDLLPLPIDHRYTTADMAYLAQSLNNIL